MNRPVRAIAPGLLLATLAAFGGTPAAGQAPIDPTKPDSMLTSRPSLTPAGLRSLIANRNTLRFRTRQSLLPVVLREFRVDEDSLVGRIQAPDGKPRRTTVAVSEIESLEYRGNSAGTGVAIGAGLGAAGGGVLGVALANWCLFRDCSPRTTGETVGAALGGVLVGSVAGGFIGMLLGSAVPDWKLLWDWQHPISPDRSKARGGTLRPVPPNSQRVRWGAPRAAPWNDRASGGVSMGIGTTFTF